MEDNQITIEINQGLTLTQNKNGLTFGSDAYLLAAFTQTLPYATSGRTMADLGSGTGIIPLLCAEKKRFSEIYAIEIQESFAALIKTNAEQNGFSDIITPICNDIRDIKAQALGKEVDVVTANPPYMKDNAGKRNAHDEKYIARHEVCGTVSDFCATAGKLLRYGGKFACVWRPDRLSELMAGLRDAGLEPKRMRFVHADLSSKPCVVLTEAIKGASPSVRISPPLILYTPRVTGESKRTLTEEAARIYETGKMEDLPLI